MNYGFAHRGGRQGPDNALATFAAALALGADGLETDAWLSLDGALVLDHDGLADAARKQPIADVRRDELPAHMATLDELYAACGTNFELAVDVKAPAAARALVECATRHDAADRLWVVVPAGSTAVLDGLPAGRRVVTIRGNVLRSAGRGAALDEAAAYDVDAVNARWMWWSRSVVDEVHERGMLALGYDAQHSFALRRTHRIGLDGVFSDHVDRLVAARAEPG